MSNDTDRHRSLQQLKKYKNMKTRREELLADFAKLNADVKVAIEAHLAKAKRDLQVQHEIALLEIKL